MQSLSYKKSASKDQGNSHAEKTNRENGLLEDCTLRSRATYMLRKPNKKKGSPKDCTVKSRTTHRLRNQIKIMGQR